MNCTETREKLVEYTENLLTDSQRREIEAHLKGCQNCRMELQQLNELSQRIKSVSQSESSLDFENAVFNRIICEQNKKLKQADGINRQLHIWRIIMKSKITKFAAAAVILVAAILSVSIFNQSVPAASAMTQVLQDAINAVSDVWSVHMKARMRTLPADNFSLIGLEYDFVPIEMWKRTDNNGQVQWRVEKPGRVLLMDGKSTFMLIRPNHGVLEKRPLPMGCFDSSFGRLLNVQDLLDNELQNSKSQSDHQANLSHQEIDGRDKIILEVDVAADVPEGDYLRNQFIAASDHLKVYRFDAETKLLESFQVYVHTEKQDVLIFEITDIEYNKEIADSVFRLDLPENMVWYSEPQVLPDNEKYVKMSPKEVATAFFDACAKEDWNEFLKFWSATAVDEQIKSYLGGLEIISIGEPFQSKGYARGSGWFVPYEIKLKSGDIKKFNLAIRNDNPAKRWVVDGGI
jgi:outer membrane lipoprotein-sorting protein